MAIPPADGGRGPGQSAGIPLRSLTAWALLAFAGVVILLGLLAWILPPSEMDLIAQLSAGQFTSTPVLVAPLLAALVAGRLGAPIRSAQLVGMLALVEYAVALLLGIPAFLVSIAGQYDGLGEGIQAVGAALQRVGGQLTTLLRLGLLALAGLWVYRIFTSLGGRLPQVNLRLD